MNISQRKRILSRVSPELFIGRKREFDKLLRQAKDIKNPQSLLLLSAPNLGGSEILRQTYDQLFSDLGETIPFYFSVKNTDKTAKQFAIRFLHSFLQQTVAFRLQDSTILDTSPDFSEIADLVLPVDGQWINKLINTYQSDSSSNDERAFIRACLSAPLRAVANETFPFVMIDNLHEAINLEGDIDIIEEIKDIYANSYVSFVLSGRRRFLFNAAQTGATRLNDAEILQVEPLNFIDAGILTEKLAEKYKVKINNETRDMIAQRFLGNPTFIKYLFQSAHEKGFELEDYRSIERIYTEKIFGGRIGNYYDTIFNNILPNVEVQKQVVGLLYDALTEKEKFPIESWQKRVGLEHEKFYRAMRLLNIHEIVRITSNMLEVMNENEVLNDYIGARFNLEVVAEPRVLVVAKALKKFLKRTPNTMAKFYRKSSAIGLRELLGVFDCQRVPTDLLDYAGFKERYKGAEDAAIFNNLENSTAKVVLPQVVYTAQTASFYAPINQLKGNLQSAVAIGFEKANYTDEDEVVWIVAEIDTKFEASQKLTEFWFDRLEMVALMNSFSNYKIWLVASEGFSPEAIDALKKRNAYGSSLKQIELLVKYLKAEDAVCEKLAPNEYEMVIPMGKDTELIAVNAVEDITRRYSTEPQFINQIKTALVEAFINLGKYSDGSNNKIYQKLRIEGDKIGITLSTRGVPHAGKKSKKIELDKDRRSWGLKLIRTLMDEVKFEQIDDGLQISMTKYVKNI